jgi:hypothetical protein
VLTFTASGPSGTTGFSNVTISKTLIADVGGLKVYLDGTETSYAVSDLTTSWLIYITYQHSTHKIAMNFAPPPSADYVSYIALTTILGFIAAFALTVLARIRGKSSKVKRARDRKLERGDCRKHKVNAEVTKAERARVDARELETSHVC